MWDVCCGDSWGFSDEVGCERIWDELTPTRRDPCVVSRSISCFKHWKSPKLDWIFLSVSVGLVLCSTKKKRYLVLIMLQLVQVLRREIFYPKREFYIQANSGVRMTVRSAVLCYLCRKSKHHKKDSERRSPKIRFFLERKILTWEKNYILESWTFAANIIDFFMIHKHGFKFIGRSYLKHPILRPNERQKAHGFLLSSRIYSPIFIKKNLQSTFWKGFLNTNIYFFIKFENISYTERRWK